MKTTQKSSLFLVLSLANLQARRTSIAQEHQQTRIIRFILSRKGDMLHSESTNDKTPEGPEIVFIYPIAFESK
ncbi:hypothetical protein [Bacteroides xylanisolvens]|uniref:Uncharacterized protein n=1 Tax=Bacteroides xylanisolvens TaxID=371601 RepID=A0A4Q5D9B1_9BACE|nr:hypothetical protein [Bacteroides xylanisolvens]KAB6078396.1 hypothetical protein GA560_22955 [Bacteroides xylanisolvens]KAB6084394.1 hypothetical protein GA551_19425 [Bacteroides xylanisolvens]KAB6092960.1 hypothetical protein GA562_18110 [Bacteroides xylanisolvens]KAB6107290.1 hypothetical protein GA564_20540 [Bacteroides xylanisolvens]RYT14571.1 hypothetical protein EAJ13_18145 [Bacteroides xylanisolvens]